MLPLMKIIITSGASELKSAPFVSVTSCKFALGHVDYKLVSTGWSRKRRHLTLLISLYTSLFTIQGDLK